MSNFDWELVRKAMDVGIVTVTFIKANKQYREMKCTLQPSMLPKVTGTSTHSGDETMIVFDVVAKGWRSFRFDRVIGVEL